MKSLWLLEYPSVELDLISPKSSDDDSRIGNEVGAPKQEPDLLGNEEITSIILEPGQTLQGTGFQLFHPQDIQYIDYNIVSTFGIPISWSMPPELRKAFNELHSTLPHVSLTARDITRWRMAWRALRPYHTQVESGDTVATAVLNNACHQQLLARRCSDWPEWYRIINVPTFLGFTAATIIYGGLHALAWSAHFDSATEKLLWRISSCVAMGGLPVILSIAVWEYHAGPSEAALSLKGRLVGRIYTYTLASPHILYLMVVVFVLMLVAYILARAYLVVECFINVFYLPAGVFETPKWSSYFPHIS